MHDLMLLLVFPNLENHKVADKMMRLFQSKVTIIRSVRLHLACDDDGSISSISRST